MLNSVRHVVPVLAAVLTAGLPSSAETADAESINRRLLPEDGVVVVELRNPAAALEHPLVQKLWRDAAGSRELKRVLGSPDFDRARHVVRMVEQATGLPWQKAFEKLTSGGVAASFQPGQHGRLSLVVAADSAKTMRSSVKALREKLLEHVPEAYRNRVVVQANHRGRDYYRVGKAAYAVVGKRFLFDSTEAGLKKQLERLPGTGEDNPASQPTAAAVASLKLTLDLDAIRKAPGFRKTLKTPADNAGAVALLGGWLDLARRSPRIDVSLTLAGNAVDVVASVPVGAGNRPQEIAGFFATEEAGPAAPLLNPPRTIYSASWCRDYRALWESRRKLLTAKAARTMEEGDKRLQQQLSVIGAKTRFSTLFTELGTKFRVVVVRQEEHDYRVDLKSRFPAAAIAVKLRNESLFREQSESLFKAIGFLATVGEAKMLRRNSKYRGAEMSSLRFRDDRNSASKGNRIRFQFSPTYCIARGHVIAGSTPEVVRAVIDELHRLEAVESSPNSASDGMLTTESQMLSLDEVAKALKDYRAPLVRALTLNLGLSLPESEKEVDVFAAMLSRMGQATARVSYDKNRFQYHVRIQPAAR